MTARLAAGGQVVGPVASIVWHLGELVEGEEWQLRRMTVTLNTYVHEWPDVLDRTRSLVDDALGQRGTAATPARSQA